MALLLHNQSLFIALTLLTLSFLSDARATVQRRGLVAPRALVGDWKSEGCYTDGVGARTLTGATYNGDKVTNEACVSFCDGKSFAYAGTEYSGECYCGNSLASTGTVAAAGDCNMPCAGDSSQTCGGPGRLSLFHSAAKAAAAKGPFTNSGPGDWRSAGCYTDGVGGRTLTYNPGTPGGTAALTVALCTSTCEQAGYNISGVEYAGQCFCGSSYSNGGGPAPDGLAGCNMVCNGNASEYCGGPNRLNVYTLPSVPAPPPGWTALGCYTDSVGARALTTTQYLAAPMTIEVCTTACKADNFAYAGLEYGGECYCGNTVANGNGPAPDKAAGCSMPCNGDATETCGGSNRINLFKATGTSPSSSATGTTTSTAVSTPTSTGTASRLPAGWKYQGCYQEGSTGRDLMYQQPDSTKNTIESCVNTCVGRGYSVAGTEYGSQCFCDNFVRNGGTLVADSKCNMPCSGNSSEFCGAGNYLSIYSNATLQVYQPPAAQKTDLPGDWTYQGCLYDDAEKRTFPYQIDFLSNNTAKNCLSLCAEFGYGAGGMEYAEQCFCGDQSHVLAAGSKFMADSDCNMPCTGNASHICGAGNRISFYNWTGPPLTTWNYASGNAAGIYEFLISGPLIPLVTTLGINNKVTFVEKFGTSPANNSTGAYEFDVTEVGNYTAAWRPMHVKTDVFCSAGLTLPDKVGRQINIGGWANDATYGTRLYWPDGSDGVWGTNDWEENVGEVKLQAGRWYPTAMIMANGSILVVGGEEGSNGAPVPSLEVLPKPAGGGVQYCDYLDRTDPYNLYPYLAVLPSGGIFIGYYNEARILDEKTLNTKRVLPNIPGAVNDFLGGRSYPMEGTSMLMPQHAPYTEPLTVMMCGGSTIGPEIALDNCVSIQPEVLGGNWTIERMPSKRVISSMVALPDGTYLILNGAQQGFAGFGLATEPNHNAVLYDPTKEVHARMTVMANTTIDRLYHSEATLLADGRVLVSGSDPEDVRFEQEYRVETYTPPYLMGGRATTRPTFTINNFTDWSYGQTVQLTVSVHNSNAATGGIKVSLLGAVSSTHGNSMGQRTIFPAVSCSGSLCTVTAPPNAHVCPPGWFQLFVLDSEGTPSVSQWVRIGGDPAKLGNWPAFPDFTVPGV